jgi:hypothetical protein
MTGRDETAPGAAGMTPAEAACLSLADRLSDLSARFEAMERAFVAERGAREALERRMGAMERAVPAAVVMMEDG